MAFIHSVGYASKDSIVIAPYPINLPTEFVTYISWLKKIVSNTSKYAIGEAESIQFPIKRIINGIDFMGFNVQDSGKTLSREKLRGIFNAPIQRHRE